MATKTTHHCDACGKEAPKEMLTVIQVSRASLASTANLKPPQEFMVKPHDICLDCKAKFKKWIESFFS